MELKGYNRGGQLTSSERQLGTAKDHELMTQTDLGSNTSSSTC